MKTLLCVCAIALDCLILGRTAHAASEPHYSLHDGKIINGDDVERAVTVPCRETFALVEHEARLYVACGAGGVAVYSLTDPTRPTLIERVVLPYGSCVSLEDDGTCSTNDRKDAPSAQTTGLARANEIPASAIERAQSRSRKANTAFVMAGVALAGSAVLLTIIPFAELVYFMNDGRPSSTEPSTPLGIASLALGGIGVACLLYGIPMSLSADAARRVSVQASPAGGSVRVKF